MPDFKSRHMIEALRSGVPSRDVGAYFSSSRGELLDSIADDIAAVAESGHSNGRIILGNYGEGKTHLLNTVASMAMAQGMAVSMLPLSKEAPANNLQTIYQKLIGNTFLPGQVQPGFLYKAENFQLNSEKTKSALLYAATELGSDRLYYVFKDFLASRDSEEHSAFEADLRGRLTTVGMIRQCYARFFGEKPEFKTKFERSKHFFDYFGFMSHLLKIIGCKGWVILFDEAELIGRLGRKSRKKAYLNMSRFLTPPHSLDSVYTVYAFASSYPEEIINGKDEYGALELGEDNPADKDAIKFVLDRICNGDMLARLTPDELRSSIDEIAQLHSKAFGTPDVDLDDLFKAADGAGYLLRTKVRAAIEYLDQVLQYGAAGKVTSTTVEKEDLSEDDSLKDLFD